MKQVVTFDALGRPQGLVHKKVGVDLTKLGHRSRSKRYSEIVYTSNGVEGLEALTGDQVVIRILYGYGKGMLMTAELYKNVTGHNAPCDGLVKGYYQNGGTGNDVMLFDSYEGAVKYEVAFANAASLHGYNPF